MGWRRAGGGLEAGWKRAGRGLEAGWKRAGSDRKRAGGGLEAGSKRTRGGLEAGSKRARGGLEAVLWGSPSRWLLAAGGWRHLSAQPVCSPYFVVVFHPRRWHPERLDSRAGWPAIPRDDFYDENL